jgi:hypothetical protein
MSIRGILTNASCASCKHWKPFFDVANFDPEHDYTKDWCKRHGRRWGRCARTCMHDGVADDQLSIAVTQDGSDYSAGLETRDDFGCVQWETSE